MLVVTLARAITYHFLLTIIVVFYPLIAYTVIYGTLHLYARQYYVVLIDDCTRFSWFFPLKHKYDFFDTFVNFQRYIETQFSSKIKSF